MKFGRKLQKLCWQALINHMTTFCDHFKANGLAKRMVHMVKKVCKNMDYKRAI
jgi:hypothetical protein